MSDQILKPDRVILHLMKMKLVKPFETSFGVTTDRVFWLVEIVDKDGVSGWGESVAMEEPWYNEETVHGNRHIIEQFLIPLMQEQPISHPRQLSERFRSIRRNMMAKSALEGALWDLYARRRGISLSKALGGTREAIEVGLSVGIQPDNHVLLDHLAQRMEAGYKRIKLKIKPGRDMDILEAARNRYPHTPMMADANSAYTLNDSEHLQQLDGFDLTMVEQPLGHDDIIDHSVLSKVLKTPVCLDESIHTLDDTRKALDLNSCSIINIKTGRVGGLADAVAIHDYCLARKIPLWCGGMLESGVGRAHNIAIASLPGFTMPGDTAGSDNYWIEDIIEPEVVARDGMVAVPKGPGIGFEVSREKLERNRIAQHIIRDL